MRWFSKGYLWIRFSFGQNSNWTTRWCFQNLWDCLLSLSFLPTVPEAASIDFGTGSLLKAWCRSEFGINKEAATLATDESIAFDTEHLDCLIGSLMCNCFVSDFDKEVTRLVTVGSVAFGTESLERLVGSPMKDCCTSEFWIEGWDKLLEVPRFPAAKQKAVWFSLHIQLADHVHRSWNPNALLLWLHWNVYNPHRLRTWNYEEPQM